MVNRIFSISLVTLVSSLSTVLSIALKKNLIKLSREYWYMWSIMQREMHKKYSIAPSAATTRYSYLWALISISVIFAISDCSWIEIDVAFVFSRLSMSSLLSKMVAGSASESCFNRLLSSSSKTTLNSFCFFTSSCFLTYNSFLSTLTTMARSWSSRPPYVTIKLMMVHWAAISGLKWGFDNFVMR